MTMFSSRCHSRVVRFKCQGLDLSVMFPDFDHSKVFARNLLLLNGFMVAAVQLEMVNRRSHPNIPRDNERSLPTRVNPHVQNIEFALP